MKARPETSPLVLVALHFEGGVDVVLGRGAADDLPRVAEWLNADELRRQIVLGAAELQLRSGAAPADAELAALVATIAPELAWDPYSVRAPMGSFQHRSLGEVLRAGEAGRRWISWALAQSWLQDPEFQRALRAVAEAEGIETASSESEDEE